MKRVYAISLSMLGLYAVKVLIPDSHTAVWQTMAVVYAVVVTPLLLVVCMTSKE
jgi:cytochrome c oxidase subunit IV